MRHKKGFIFSVIAISFMLLLMFLAIAMSNEYWETERVVAKPQPLSYAKATLENIGKQFVDVVLPNALVSSDNESMTIWISDSAPRPGIAGKLNSLKTFVEDDLADSLHADISVNTTNVSSGYVEATIAQSYVYESGRNGSQEVALHPLVNGSSLDADEYWLNFTINEYRNTVDAFNFPGGDLNVTVRYTDRNGTVVISGGMNPNVENRMSITYGENETEWIEIILGEVDEVEGFEWDGSLWMNTSNTTSASFAFAAKLPLASTNETSLIELQIPMNYTQGGIYKEMKASR
jgi:hypothetical protein